MFLSAISIRLSKFQGYGQCWVLEHSEEVWTMGRLYIATSLVKSWLVTGIYDFSPLLAALICGEQVFIQASWGYGGGSKEIASLMQMRCTSLGVRDGTEKNFNQTEHQKKKKAKQNILPPQIAFPLCFLSPMVIRL